MSDSNFTYVVYYDGNGATGGSTASSTHQFGVAQNLTENGFYKVGNRFVNWNTEADGSGTSYSNKQSVVDIAGGGSVSISLDEDVARDVYVVDGLYYFKVSDIWTSDPEDYVGMRAEVSDIATGEVLEDIRLTRSIIIDVGYVGGSNAFLFGELGLLVVPNDNTSSYDCYDDYGRGMESGTYIYGGMNDFSGFISRIYDVYTGYEEILCDSSMFPLTSNNSTYFYKVSDEVYSTSEIEGGTITYKGNDGEIYTSAVNSSDILTPDNINGLGSVLLIPEGGATCNLAYTGLTFLEEGVYFGHNQMNWGCPIELSIDAGSDSVTLYAQWEKRKFPSGFYVFTNGEWKYCKPYIYLEKKDLVSKDEYKILDANGLELEGDDSWENIR